MDSHRDTPHGKRLDSWKAISSFFRRDERTVKRWEATRGLPVHRVPGRGHSSVFAYADELAEWLDGAADKLKEAPEAREGDGEPLSRSGSDDAPRVSSVHAISGTDATPAGKLPVDASRRSRRLLALLALAVAVAGAVYFLEGHFEREVPNPAKGQTAHAVSRQAEELYLKGVYDWNNRTPQSLNRAVDEYSQALRIDPSLAPGYVGLAKCYLLLREFGTMPEAEAYAKAEQAAQRALALDENLAEAHATMGFVDIYWHWDARSAQREYQRAIALDPNLALSHHWYATSLFTMGNYREALAEIDRARELDPQSSPILADRGLILAVDGQTQQAMRELKELELSNPGFLSPHAYLASIYLEASDEQNYLREARTVATLRRDEQQLVLLDAAEKGLAAAGRRGMFQAMLDVQKRRYAQGEESALALAQTYAWLGDKADALRCLQVAWEQHESALISVRNYPAFDPLHSDPSFQRLVAQVWTPATQTKP